MNVLSSVLLLGSAFLAGAVNAVAGGGTLLTFPALLAAGVLPIEANATSTVALVPGSAGAFLGYRSLLEGPRERAWLLAMALPSVVGGVLGALLALRVGDARFARTVPWLVLGATLLFLVQVPVQRRLFAHNASTEEPVPTRGALFAIALFQCLVALYGGFFGAGIGILMLAALGLAGHRDIHRSNGLKTAAAMAINGVAAVTFAFSGRVRWPIALSMALAALLGGYAGAGLAKRAGPTAVRTMVIIIGLTVSAVLFLRQK